TTISPPTRRTRSTPRRSRASCACCTFWGGRSATPTHGPSGIRRATTPSWTSLTPIDMTDTIADFNAFRSRMNDLILGAGHLTINRFFALDGRTYEAGALGVKTKEMLGLVSSLVLRCDD